MVDKLTPDSVIYWWVESDVSDWKKSPHFFHGQQGQHTDLGCVWPSEDQKREVILHMDAYHPASHI